MRFGTSPTSTPSSAVSVEQMVTLAREAFRILKDVDSTITVVSPSATTTHDGLRWLDSYLRGGGGRFCDVIGFHFYVMPRPPEAMETVIDSVWTILGLHDLSNRSLWNTETGWYMGEQAATPQAPGALSDSEGGAYVARAFLLGWAHGLSRFYWYAWDNSQMGLTRPDGQTNRFAATAYETVRQWMAGARMSSVVTLREGFRIVELDRASEPRRWVVWRLEGMKPFFVPDSIHVARIQTLSGRWLPLPADNHSRDIDVGGLPILLQVERH